MSELAAPIPSNKNQIDFNKSKDMISPVLPDDVLNSSPSLTSLANKNILITGGAGGLGRAMALSYLSAGAYVTIGDLDVKNGSKLASEHTRLEFQKCNVMSWEEQSSLFKYAHGRRGGLDIVVANAGITERGFVCDDDLERPGLATLDINLRAQFYTAKLAHYYLRRSTSPDKSLVLVGSMASLGEIPGAPEYTAAKHGMLGLMRSLRRTSPNDGIRVNSIHPWFVETGIIDVREKLLLAGTQFAKIEDVVRAVNILSVNKVNGRGLAIMSPDVGIVDLFKTDDSTGDFRVFMDRVQAGFMLRSKVQTRIAIVRAIIVNLSKPIYTFGSGVPLALAVAYFLRRYFKSMRGQVMLMQLVQQYHSLRGN